LPFRVESELLKLTPKLLADRTIVSAALMSQPLGRDQLYVAAEWWGRFLISTDEAHSLDQIRDRLDLLDRYEPLDLMIFAVSERPVEQTTQDLRIVDVENVIATPGSYYGRLASPDFGGANALFAAGLESARERGMRVSQILVGSPGDFGFEVDDGETSVIHWRRKGKITVDAFGFSLNRWRQALKQFDDNHQFDREALPSQIDAWTQADYDFGLAIILHGLQDPPVKIPLGSVYQQPLLGSKSQNLAVAQGTTQNVGLGATVPLVLPAWCLNPTLSPPHGQMAPTALTVPWASGPQHAVWDVIRTRYRGRHP
jgi:hypothetical protein